MPECVASRAEQRAGIKGLDAAELAYIREHPSMISKDEAIDLAIRFLHDQGFTTAAPAIDEHSVRRDFVEVFSLSKTLAGRRDTVDPTPIGARRAPKAWHVAFQRSARLRAERVGAVAGRNETFGPTVSVSLDGTHSSMQHQDSCLALFMSPYVDWP